MTSLYICIWVLFISYNCNKSSVVRNPPTFPLFTILFCWHNSNLCQTWLCSLPILHLLIKVELSFDPSVLDQKPQEPSHTHKLSMTELAISFWSCGSLWLHSPRITIILAPPSILDLWHASLSTPRGAVFPVCMVR